MKKSIILIIITLLCLDLQAQNWTPLTPPANRNYYGCWFDDANPNNGFAVSWYFASFDYIPYAIHTSNGGNSFTPMQTFCAGQDLWFTTSYSGVIVGNGINQTTDGGATWNIIEDVTAMQAGWLYDVMFTNGTDGYAIGQRYDFSYTNYEGVLYKTNNAGGSWTNITVTEDINNENTEFRAIYSTGNGVIYAGCHGFWPGASTLYKSVDDGVTWTPLSFTENTFSLYFTSADSGFAGTSNGIYLTTDAGATWSNILPISQTVGNIQFKDGIAFATVAGGNIYMSTDNGTTWNLMTSPVSTALQDIYIVNHNLAYISGNSGTILKYTNTTGLTVYQHGQDMRGWVDAANNILYTEWDNSEGAMCQVEIFDMRGSKMLEQTFNSGSGFQQQTISLESLPAGVYALRMKNGNRVFTSKITITQI